MTRHRRIVFASLCAATLVAMLAVAAPFLGAEYLLRGHGPVVSAARPPLLRGRWLDDYFVVEPIDATTLAIGEPRYYQGNYSYLLLGTQRALLFDAGTGTRDILPLIRSLTSLPVTVLPSHLHFDHVGALGRFERTALPDLPELRERAGQDQLTLRRYEFLGFGDALAAPQFAVTDWLTSGAIIDLGGRRIRVLFTPGHTPSSVSLLDQERQFLFAGDFLYPGSLYAFLPGASRGAYLATTRMLLREVNSHTRILAAHMAEDPAGARAPVMEYADLQALERTLLDIDAGNAASQGWYPRVYPVRGAMTFATGLPWNGR